MQLSAIGVPKCPASFQNLIHFKCHNFQSMRLRNPQGNAYSRSTPGITILTGGLIANKNIKGWHFEVKTSVATIRPNPLNTTSKNSPEWDWNGFEKKKCRAFE
jgi:hypothetical protein